MTTATCPHPATPTASEASLPVALAQLQGHLVACIGGREPVPVRICYARPVTSPHGEIALMDARKHCIAMLPGIDALDAASRDLAAEELRQRYCIARILRVHATRVDFGNRYWEVETDRGQRQFLLRDAGKNVQQLPPDRLAIRDALGNRYEIPSLRLLDEHSRLEAEKAL